jgi:hypothetical protein
LAQNRNQPFCVNNANFIGHAENGMAFRLDMFPALAVKQLVFRQSLTCFGIEGWRSPPAMLQPIARYAKILYACIAASDKIEARLLFSPRNLVNNFVLSL